MFERYTGNARRVIFFARYEASQYGSPVINTEHLLRGFLRENKSLDRWLSKASPETIRRRIGDHSPPQPPTSTNSRSAPDQRFQANSEIRGGGS
jgi:ATP-dependent Clp protease ATP-binding subunit ClpC